MKNLEYVAYFNILHLMSFIIQYYSTLEGNVISFYPYLLWGPE